MKHSIRDTVFENGKPLRIKLKPLTKEVVLELVKKNGFYYYGGYRITDKMCKIIDQLKRENKIRDYRGSDETRKYEIVK